MRTVTEIIVHCTATPEGRMVSVATIRKWHTDPEPKGRGWKDIGYHYIIHLDGQVEPGRPVEQIGSHVAVRNTNTIGIVYVGGVDANLKAKDTRTPEQKAALIKLIRELMVEHPTIYKISGHNQYANKACPSFNAGAEYAYLTAAPRKPSPTPMKGKGMAKSKTGWSSVVAGGLGAVATGREVVTAAKTVQETSSDASALLMAAGPWVICAVVIVAACAFIWFDRRGKMRDYGI